MPVTLATAYEKYRSTASEELGKPYFPNVSVGWDSSPRACRSDKYTNATYPFMHVVKGNTPERFGGALCSAKEFLKSSKRLEIKLLTINSWNEWTEGSYLEPDVEHEFAYLDQVQKVLVRATIDQLDHNPPSPVNDARVCSGRQTQIEGNEHYGSGIMNKSIN
ncbi:hypothetical protein BDZ45DRAFT_801857 [Acephala macrosclerotiorum]|nr:hypothetical protein BDZ45DRAFT_801857 [Acephala macrosclerotiorum]